MFDSNLITDPELKSKFDNLELKMFDWWKVAKMLSPGEYGSALLDYHEREYESWPVCDYHMCMCIYKTGCKCWTKKPCRWRRPAAS